MKSESKQKFSLTGLLVVIGSLALLTAILIPAISRAKLQADLHMVGSRGKDIFVVIVGANTMSEFPANLWPKAQIDGEDNRNVAEAQDIIEIMFQNSTRYFYVLLDGENRFEPSKFAPYVNGLDWSKLAGAGVPELSGRGELQPENNMWSIAGNISDDMEDLVPLLVTRNVDCSSFHIKTQANPDTPLRWSQQYVTPFGSKGFVIVRKGGAVFRGTAKYATTGAVYPVGGGVQSVAGNTNLASLVYLTPDGIAYPK